MIEDPLQQNMKAAVEAGAQQIADNLYKDIKHFLVSLGSKVLKPVRRVSIRKYDSFQEIKESLVKNELQEGQWVKVKVVISPFGPFLRYHFLTPFIGNHTSLRLGPPIVSQNPIMGMMAQITSHLIPVGIYPPLSEQVSQVCLYPVETTACGFIGVIPGINELVPYANAILPKRFTPFYNIPVWLTGTIRFMDALTLIDTGFSVEDHEVLRQAGKTWFIDATHDESSCEIVRGSKPVELWGGLYASGHLDIGNGSLRVDKTVEAIRDGIEKEGYKTQVTQNQVRRMEFAIFAEGFRSVIDSQLPFYSLHMDTNLTDSFGTSRQCFDRIINNVLCNIKQLCCSESVELLNSFDLDFSYSNSNKVYTILQSASSDNVKDPLAIAIRDWYKKGGYIE